MLILHSVTVFNIGALSFFKSQYLYRTVSKWVLSSDRLNRAQIKKLIDWTSRTCEHWLGFSLFSFLNNFAFNDLRVITDFLL